MAEQLVTDIARGYREMLRDVLRYGTVVDPRGHSTIEIMNYRVTVVNPTDVLLLGTGRKMSPQLAALEALQLVGGFSDPALTVQVAPHYARFMDDGVFHGSYGQRTAHQIGLAAERLRLDPATRRAVVTFWDPRLDLAREGLHDYPCTVSAAFHVRHGGLDMSTVMRSNDAWLGWPYDVVQFTTLQRALAAFLKLPVGIYSHFVQSFHLYESDLSKVSEFLDEQEPAIRPTRPTLEGGIAGKIPMEQWRHVQTRAMQICYRPHSVQNATPEEEWFVEQAKKWQQPT